MTKSKPEVTDYRKQLKGKILETAFDMFKNQGLKAVKMDDISKALTISKRTLYEIYPNKEDLAFETVKYGLALSHERLVENISKTSGDTMDVLTEFFRMHIAESQETNVCLYDDIRQYPKIKEYLDNHRREHATRTIEFLMKGQEEGYFIKNINLDIFRELNTAVSNHFITGRMFAKFSSRDVLCTVLSTFVRGVCTSKGIERIDELLRSI